MDQDRWIAHFHRNRQDRPEPDWDAPLTMEPRAHHLLTRSLEQFQLGDGGGPARLIAWNARRRLAADPLFARQAALWFAEEKEHSRLLGEAVRRYGGRPITGHWSFSCFLFCRRCFGLGVELTVLLMTEIASTAYYRLMQRHCGDSALEQMCALILRDEAAHILFHGDRMRRRGAGLLGRRSRRMLGHAAATMLWVNHGPALRALGATTGAFYGELRRELDRFEGRLGA
ncbi:MAG: ferritin-like domain-containing protein [Pseudomonadota bacterium]